jgi:DNA-binding winged helix-turn-helix (wHTH) protein/tetratricopeptide (TPR) repeat protein/TolB-like protein
MSLKNSSSFLRFFSVAEMNGGENQSYRFKSFLLKSAERQLLRDGETVALTPKVFDTLVYLVKRAGHLVEKQELMDSVWRDSFVEEGNLARSIYELRRALGQDKNGNKFIETIPTKGYRFVAEVTAEDETPPPAMANGNISTTDAWPDQREISKAEVVPTTENHFAKRVVFLGLAGSIVASFIFFLAFAWNPERPAVAGGPVSIAVLPVRPVDTGNRDQIYEIGIADSLIVLLGRQGMSVRPLSAVRGYLDVEQDVLAAGKEQKVDFVLASTYRLANGRVRVSSQLMNVRTGSIEDSFSFDEGNAEVLAASDAIASQIGRRLLAKLNVGSDGPKAKKGTTNSEAYRLYLQGINLVNRRTGEDHVRAVEYFEKALALDPNYALAHFGLGYARVGIALPGGDKLEERQKARASAQKALALDPDLAEAYALLAEIVTIDDWNHTEAEKLFQRALELDPKSSHANRHYSFHLSQNGRFDEALHHIKTVIDLDPNSGFDQRNLGMILYLARRYDEAIVQLEGVKEMFPEQQQTPGWLMYAYAEKGDYQKVFDNFLLTPQGKNADAATKASWHRAFSESGWPGVQRLRLEAALRAERPELQATVLAGMAASLGQTDVAIAQLKRACDTRLWSVVLMKVHPALDPLRSDPRFQELLRRVNLS